MRSVLWWLYLFFIGTSMVHAQETRIVGGWLFDGVQDTVVPNTGIVVRGGKIMSVGSPPPAAPSSGVPVIRLTADDYILPGLFDLHAHYAIDLFGEGRVDETGAYPAIFLANGVTSTFPAGEVDPDSMQALSRRIAAGAQAGPRLHNSGAYFGTWREGWDRDATVDAIVAEVDYWAGRGVRGFKAKGISPAHLEVLIARAHEYGLPVTGHLGSGFRNSVNPRDAILMGIDRVEHFLGGDATPADRSAYESLENLDPTAPEVDSIIDLFIRHGVFFDATLTAYGYFGERDPDVYTYFTDEQRFFTPYMQQILSERPARPVREQFEKIYWIKRKTVKRFYDAGGAHLITLGTDHPSWGEYLSGFSVHRELHAFVLAGIPAASALKFATANAARALNMGSYLGTVEPGKFADLVVVTGNPLSDIRNTRNTKIVMKAGWIYNPRALLGSVEGSIGPSGPDEIVDWTAAGRRTLPATRNP